MFKKYFIFLFVLLANHAFCQEASIDSLFNILDQCETDTCKINTFLEISENYETINPELMFKYYSQAEKLLVENPAYTSGKKKSLEVLANYYYSKGEFEKTLEIYLLIQEFNYNAQDTLELIKIMTNQSTVLETLGQYNKAVGYCYDALALSDKMGYLDGAADCYNNLAIIFFRQKEYNKSLEHFNKVLENRKITNRPNELAAIYNNLGLVYFAKENLDKAMSHFLLAVDILKANHLEQQLASGYINLGGLLTEMGKFDEALTYYNKALEVMEQTNNQIGIANAKMSIGEFYLKKNNEIEKGISISLEGLELAKKTNYFAGQKGGYDILKNLYYKDKKYQKALLMYEKYVALEDSLTSISYKTEIAELEQKYQIAKTEQENLALESLNEKIAKNLQKFVLWGTLIILILIATIIGVGLFFRQRELKYKLLAIELEQKALKAQMNPHFIFNALVSIQSCIIEGDRITAYTYQSKFAKLLRLILQNSEEKSITLKKELESLRLYIELEQFRVEGKFDFIIDVEHEDIKSQMAPSMLFQPFAENAIWHGLMTKKDEKGLLSIKLTKENNQIKCIIDDNGIGRKQAEINKMKLRNPNHKSMGVDVTKSRIEIFNRENGSNVQVVFHDKYEQGVPKGTTVVFYLPFIS